MVRFFHYSNLNATYSGGYKEMKINELSVGSLVLLENKICEIKDLYGSGGGSAYLVGSEIREYADIHEISGVQLTNDIFKKLGFVWHKDAWVRGYLIITTYAFNNHVFDCKGFAIQYVHQLQVLANLLRAELNTKSIL